MSELARLIIAKYLAAALKRLRRISPPGLRRWLDAKRHNLVLNFLQHTLQPVISSHLAGVTPSSDTKPEPRCKTTWSYWHHGETEAPAIVRACFNSMRRNIRGSRLVVLSAINAHEYVELDQAIVKKHTAGLISDTHFSDALRIRLLRDHGGHWLDATVLVPNAQVIEPHGSKFISPRLGAPVTTEYVSMQRWAIYDLYTPAHNALFSFLNEAVEHYWQKHDNLVDYHLTDYMLELAYRNNIGNAQAQVNNAPISDCSPSTLLHEFYKPSSITDLKKRLTTITARQKLTWKIERTRLPQTHQSMPNHITRLFSVRSSLDNG